MAAAPAILGGAGGARGRLPAPDQVREDYSQITCPVYAIGGWVDAYKNGVFRLLAGLKAPRKGLVGKLPR